MAEKGSTPIQRWTDQRRSALVLGILKGETSVREAARKHGLTVAEVERWKERFQLGAENALRAHSRRPAPVDEVLAHRVRELIERQLSRQFDRMARKPTRRARDR